MDGGRVLVEDCWNRGEERYEREVNAEPDKRLNERLARFLFDHGRWPGRPQKETSTLVDIVEAVLVFRWEHNDHHDPAQIEFLDWLYNPDHPTRDGPTLGRMRTLRRALGKDGDLGKLQRALDGTFWWEVSAQARKIEADRAAHPDEVVTSGIVSYGKCAVRDGRDGSIGRFAPTRDREVPEQLAADK